MTVERFEAYEPRGSTLAMLADNWGAVEALLSDLEDL